LDVKRLIEMKGSTRGLNTDKLNGKNLHLCVQPRPEHRHSLTPGAFAIVEDHWVRNETKLECEWAVNDIDLVVACEERVGLTYRVPLPEERRSREEMVIASHIATQSMPSDADIYVTLVNEVKPQTLGWGFRLMPPWVQVISHEKPDDFMSSDLRQELRQTRLALPEDILSQPDSSDVDRAPLHLDFGLYERTVEYYYGVLCYRKLLGQRIKELLKRKGQNSSPGAVEKAILNLSNGPNLLESAMDYVLHEGHTDVFRDELLIATATINSIFYGRSAVLLTKKRNVVDQCRALWMLLYAHYVGWAVASERPDDVSPTDFIWGTGPKMTEIWKKYLASRIVKEAAPHAPISAKLSCYHVQETSCGNAYFISSTVRLPRPMWTMFANRDESEFLSVPNLPDFNIIGGRETIDAEYYWLEAMPKGSIRIRDDEIKGEMSRFSARNHISVLDAAAVMSFDFPDTPWRQANKTRRLAEKRKRERKKKRVT
jgi:hypothetical protein